MRTEEQKQAFVMECLEIEKAGGDVLGHIEMNWTSYTPRATWYNLQRRFLHRSAAQLTEGKPKGSGMRMGKMQEVANAVMDAYARGENVYDWLEKNGYRNPSSQWYQLKLYAQKHDMELYERMCDVKQERRKAKPRTEMSAPINFPEEPVPDLKAGEPMPVKLPAGGKIEAGKPSPFPDPDYSNEMIIPRNTGDHVSAEKFRKTVEFKGKEYERMNKPSPTCCQPAPESGVTVPDELPPVDRFVLEDNSGNKCEYTDEVDAWDPDTLQKYKVYPVGSHERIAFKPTRVQSLLGTWQNNVKDQTFTFAPNEPNGGFISMPITDWLNLAAEIPEAIKALMK